MSYKDEIPRGEGLDRFQGVSFTKTGTPHSVFVTGGEAGDTIFRCLPEMQNGVEIPFRVGEGNFNFSYFMTGKRLIRGVGVNNKFSCMVEVLGKPRDHRGPIDRFTEEIFKVTEGVKRGRVAAASIPQEWLQWVTRGQSAPYGALRRVETAGLMQGLLFRCGKQTFEDSITKQPAPKAPVLLIIPKTAREKVEKFGNNEVPGYQGPRDAWEQRYEFGEAIKLSSGRLFQFIFQSGVEGAQNGTGTLSTYLVNILPQIWPVSVQDAANMYVPWGDLLRFHTEEEQMELLVAHFPPEALDYVFGHSNLATMLPEAVRGRWHNRAAFVTPPQAPAAYGQPQQYAPPQGNWAPGQPLYGAPPPQHAYPAPAPQPAPQQAASGYAAAPSSYMQVPSAPVPPPAPMPAGFTLPAASPAGAGGFLPPKAGAAAQRGAVPQFGAPIPAAPAPAAPMTPMQIPGFQLPAAPEGGAIDDQAPWVTGNTQAVSPSVGGSFPAGAPPVSTPPPAAPGASPMGGVLPDAAQRLADAKAKLDAAQRGARPAQ